MTDPDFRHTLRVYWEDTDAGGVVFFANYLKFFERARTEWLRQLGVAQQRLRADTGAIFVVADTSVRYLSPARLDDELQVTVQVVDAGRASMTLSQQAWRAGELLAEGRIRIGCVDAGTFKPRRIPNELLSRVS
ncbi:MAG TPA: tol-pal system-associated acyl-CoA thioesterase [Albitalea sp.]|nr:tol-pal system-associated acyl-CoA thioesterase [Albitalea sp.]